MWKVVWARTTESRGFLLDSRGVKEKTKELVECVRDPSAIVYKLIRILLYFQHGDVARDTS